ncbi:MAG: class I SAM-dependent methyltransferase [Gemmatimonadaceae bacterium]|nr:class I SAM-dependent methyltransferase [Gemmatimonadaceae bacterium]
MTALSPYHACPLCEETGAESYHVAERVYLRCRRCRLVFVRADQLPTRTEEVLRYEKHRRDAGSPGHVLFLERLAGPLCDAVPLGARGLDFGCGPQPVLAHLLHARGRPTEWYDPVFHPDEHAIQSRYDFVACSEVVEHAHRPGAMFTQLAGLLRPGGTLAVMTSCYPEPGAFAEWWYRRDISHVAFYSHSTFQWIARRHGWTVRLPAPDISIFTAP